MEEQPRRERMSDYDFGGKRVLLAEDLEFNAEIASEFLAEAGLVTETACNGAGGGGEVRQFAGGLLQPYIHGYPDADSGRLSGGGQNTRSGPYRRENRANSRDDGKRFHRDVKTAKEHGMNGHVAKPLEVRELTAALKKWIPGFKTKNQS